MSPAIHQYTKDGLTFQTQANRVEDDWYQWQIELMEPSATLNKIDVVEYMLHPSFPHSIRRQKNADEHFKLESEAWGEFNITVNVYFKGSRDEKTIVVPLKLS